MHRKAKTDAPAPNARQGGAGLDGPDVGSLAPALSRRKILVRVAGLAAVGAAGGSVVAEAFASPASAATTTEVGALAPAVVALTDAARIAVDASLGNDFRVTIGGNRILGNPANPVDGQKIIFQITQGNGGPFTMTWDNLYEFSTGLPQPALSTTAGQTDLLAFIYNGAKGKWLLAAYVNGFNPAPITAPPGTYRLFPTTAGPASPASYTGPFLAGIAFEVTTGGCWFEGYWWWVCGTGQSTGPQKFALWQVYNTGVGALISTATATSGALTAGQWNYVPLATPIPLAVGSTYVASTGLNNNFPLTNDQFGSGQPYSAGIVKGPVQAFSDLSGSARTAFGMNQGLYGTVGSDPTVNMPNYGYASGNFWMDLQVGTSAPAGASCRLWPNYPTPPGHVLATSLGYTLATEFLLSKSCVLDKIWFYSPPGAGALPTRCAIWTVATQSEVAGTDNAAPTWSGAVGSGWVSCPYNGVTLAPGDYKVAVFYAGGASWLQANTDYWDTGGQAAQGITTGPLTAPGVATASGAGQSTYHQDTWAYPLTYASIGNGENYWVDIEVTPS